MNEQISFNETDWIYENLHNETHNARFLLGTRGVKTLVCFGINTSTAVPNKLDPTVTKVKNIALRNGYDSFMMMNVYPQRATDPNDLHLENDIFLKETNEKHIAKFINNQQYDILAAWGNLIEKRSYLYPNLVDIASLTQLQNASWFCLGQLTKSGHPRHPLYIRLDEKIEGFDIKSYIRKT